MAVNNKDWNDLNKGNTMGLMAELKELMNRK